MIPTKKTGSVLRTKRSELDKSGNFISTERPDVVPKIPKCLNRYRFNIKVLFILFLAVLAANVTHGQEPTLIIENGRVIVGNGTVLEEGTVLLSGNRIVSVTAGKVNKPGIRKIDASGKTIMPGLIDAHVHLLVSSTSTAILGKSERSYANPPTPIQMNDSLADAYIENQLPAKLSAYLEAGITTIRSTGDYWPEITEVKGRLISNELSGPRLQVVGPVFTWSGHPAHKCRDKGQWNEWCRSHLVVMCRDKQTAREAVRRVAESGADAIKIVGLDHGGLSDRDIIRTIAREAEQQGIPVIMHVTTPKYAHDALIWGTDQFAHTPHLSPDSKLTEKIVSFMRMNEVYAVSTLSILDQQIIAAKRQGDWPRVEEKKQEIQEAQWATRLIAEEGRLVLGTDSPMQTPEEALYSELRLLSEGGLSEEQIIQAATVNAARQLGLEDLGTLEKGNLADLIVVDGNPLEDISALQNIKVVVKDGNIVVNNRE